MRLIDAEALKMYAGLAVNDDGTAYALCHIIDAAPTVACERCAHRYNSASHREMTCYGCFCGSNFSEATDG